MSREVGNKRNVARALSSLGDIVLHQGDLDAATKRYEEALTISKEVGEKGDLAIIYAQMGNVLLAQGKLSEARRQHEEALAIRQAIGQKRIEPDSDLDLARLAIEEGRFAERGTSRPVERPTAFRGQQAAGGEASALVARGGRALRRRHEAGRGAAGAIDRADRPCHGAARIVFVRIPAGDHERADRWRQWQAARAWDGRRAPQNDPRATDTLGLFTLQLETRLALGVLELAGVNPAAGRDRLAALESYAGEKGFGLIARKARAAKAAR